MKLSADTPQKKARIEIIPLIDIMFFLLASFMLVSMSMIKLQRIETHLPSKTKAPPPPTNEKPDFTVLALDPKGNVYYDKDQNPVEADVIISRLQEIYKAKGAEKTKVFINCDKEAKYDRLITVLDAVRSVGISKVSFSLKLDNTFDPLKPRPNTHTGAPGAEGAAPAGAPAAPAPAAAPAAPSA